MSSFRHDYLPMKFDRITGFYQVLSLASPMQVILEPFPSSDVGGPVVVDTIPKSTIATLISSYCAIKDVALTKKWEIVDEKERALPSFSTLASLGVTDGQKLRIRYQRKSFLSKEKWPLLIALTALVICVVGILIISMIYGLTGGKYLDDFGVVMDAGSSKTNTILYTWKSNKQKGTGCVKQDKTCLVSGGIAEMDPMKLDPVIECAEKVSSRVDPKARSQTPLFFAATAGMRLKNLTNPGKVEEILEKLNTNLTQTGLSVRAIEVISGDDEGIYGWIASNFLRKTLEEPLKENPWVPTTYGALDMGGASMQISHTLSEAEGKNLSGIKPITLYDQTHYLFSMSNLCFGRLEAERRYRNLLVQSLSAELTEDPCSPADFEYNVTAKELIDLPCTQSKRFDAELKKNPDLINKNVTFIGTSKPLYCKGNVSKLLDNDLCTKSGFHECFRRTNSGSKNEKFLAFATYFFTTDFLNVTKSSLDQYRKAAQTFCLKNKTEVETYTKKDYGKQYCFNSQYIYEALITGFNFTEETWEKIEFVGKIEGIDVGWTLGYMINATNIIPEKEKTPKLISATALTVCLILFILVVVGAIIFILRSRDKNYGSV